MRDTNRQFDASLRERMREKTKESHKTIRLVALKDNLKNTFEYERIPQGNKFNETLL